MNNWERDDLTSRSSIDDSGLRRWPCCLPSIILWRNQVQGKRFQRGLHVNGITLCVAEHQADERLLHRVGRALQLRLECFRWNVRNLELSAARLLEQFDHLVRAERFWAA